MIGNKREIVFLKGLKKDKNTSSGSFFKRKKKKEGHFLNFIFILGLLTKYPFLNSVILLTFLLSQT